MRDRKETAKPAGRRFGPQVVNAFIPIPDHR